MPEIEVWAAPVPKARPRMGRGGRVFTPRGTELAEQRIREAWVERFGPRSILGPGIGFGLPPGPLYVEVLVRLARPAGHFGRRGLLPSAPRWPYRRPDIDNYAKTALDALRGVAFVDDAQIVRLDLAKVYVREGEVPGWRIGVFPMEDTGDGDERTRPAPGAGADAAAGGRAAPEGG